MSDFSTDATRRNVPDQNKRVNYTQGLVLGVDDFEQEQAYFLERTRQLTRDLSGYGTVCGLDLTTDGSTVRVSSGMAIDRRGRVIVVKNDQSGDLNAWLNEAANQASVGSSPRQYSLYVTLCYAECLTDPLPTPGAPGRTEGDAQDYSRVTETFNLQFSPTAPDAKEEAAVRSFGDLLHRLKVTSSGAGPFLQHDGLVPYVRGLLLLESAVPSRLPGPTSSPLGGPLWVKPADAAEVLRQALRVWTTEIRPQLLPGGANGAGGEDCILLGRVDFSITNARTVDLSARVTPAQGQRPILLHTRLLQEWLLSAIACQPAGLAPTPAPQPTGNFVQSPAALPVYNMIAAGVLSASAARQPLYDPSLKASVLGAGQLLITFKGYKMPDATFTYIVKALAVCNEKVHSALSVVAPLVNFDAFTARGIVLSVSDNGKAIDPQPLGKLEVMVEISFYKIS